MKTKRDVNLAYSWNEFEISHTNRDKYPESTRFITLNRQEAVKLTAFLLGAVVNDVTKIVLDSFKKKARK